jgi:hypothetical protein
VREVANARAESYEDRFTPYVGSLAGGPGPFDFTQFNSNTVLRWEYHPGSSLYLVWTQGRQDFEPVGGGVLSDDFDHLFHVQPANTFLVKVVHWFDW